MDAVTRVYRVRRTCFEMLNDRGYLALQTDLSMTKEAFTEKFGPEPRKDDLTILCSKQDDPTDQIFVFFAEDGKVGVGNVKSVAERMRDASVSRAILVSQTTLTPFARQCIAELASKYVIESFLEQELLINITQHVLVPQHEVLTASQKKQLLQRCGCCSPAFYTYKVKDTQLPRIQYNDPVARYYGMARGQVVRIVRPSETAGRYVTYRLCV